MTSNNSNGCGGPVDFRFQNNHHGHSIEEFQQHNRHQRSNSGGKNSSNSSSTSTTTTSMTRSSSAIGAPYLHQHPNQQQQHQNNNAIASGTNQGIDLYSLSQHELVQRVKKLEADLLKLACDHNSMIREANQQIQIQSSELGNLKSTITRLEEDNTELRDLCCFLDDDRQKGRKLAREWQRFGRYTATVMRQEVAAYQSKLRDLDLKQQQLVSDNMELKELCLYLDEERNQNFCSQCSAAAFRRDDGDGSSSTTNPTEEYIPQQLVSSMESTANDNSLTSNNNSTNTTNSSNYNENVPNCNGDVSSSDTIKPAQGIFADLSDETSRGILSSMSLEIADILEQARSQRGGHSGPGHPRNLEPSTR